MGKSEKPGIEFSIEMSVETLLNHCSDNTLKEIWRLINQKTFQNRICKLANTSILDQLISREMEPGNKGDLFMMASEVFSFLLSKAEPDQYAEISEWHVGKALSRLGFKKYANYNRVLQSARYGYYIKIKEPCQH